MSLVEVEPFGVAEREAAPPDAGDGSRRQADMLQIAWHNRWLILFSMLLGAAAAWLLLQRVTPLYTSMSRIYVERTLPRFLSPEAQVAHSGNTYLYTQAELIRSTPVLAAAAHAPENARLASFRDVDNPVAFLRERVQVMVGSQDDIINVSAELADPHDAAQIVNSIVDAYITQYAEQRRTNTVEVLTILRNEKERRDAELEERRQALAAFRENHAALSVKTDDGNVIVKQFAVLSEELNRTELDLLEARARYNRVKRMYDAPAQRPFLLETASSEQRLARDLDLERQVQQIELSLTGERARWGEGHPRVRLLRESLDEMRSRLNKQQQAIIEAYVRNLAQQCDVLEQKLSELRTAYDRQFDQAKQVSAQALELAALQDALSRTERLCDILDERIKEINLTEEVGAMNVSIMEFAAPATMPSSPRRARFLAAGLMLGGLGGFGLAWLRDLLDHRLRSIDEIASVLQLPVLGAVPLVAGRQERAHGGRIVALSPRSTPAEAIRTLRTSIHFGFTGDDAKILAVTSPSPGDGKSTVASNLAIAMAQAGQKVLLVDGDMRKPTQHEIFDVASKIGLSSVLAERRPVTDVIVPAVYVSLDLLPCGPLPNNPVELLNNGYFAELLEELRQRYDRIILDSPPVMPVADARVVAAVTDATLLVLRAERSTRRVSLAARNELWKVRATRLGVVVNAVPGRKHGYYGYDESDYGYGQYGGYGYGNEAAAENDRSKRQRLAARSASEETAASAGSAS